MSKKTVQLVVVLDTMDAFKKNKYYSSPLDSDSEDEHKSKKFVMQ